MYNDTIVAIATPPGIGGIGIIRVSGAAAYSIVHRLFKPGKSSRTPPTLGTPRMPFRSHRVYYGHIVDPADGTIVDEVLVLYMKAPRSFTREDVLEISGHGGTLPLQRILTLLLHEGARLADPGEFTLRAFLNGRIDLSQAEATLDVIHAQTNTALALAQEQLGGWLANDVRHLRSVLLDVLSYLTVTIDFPDDEVDQRDVLPGLYEAQQTLSHLLATADEGIVYRQGARVVLLGRPNVGKSSLLNVLLRTNRAIVTHIPGTTRDTLEEVANLAGIPVILTDTAGITESDDPIERLGIERSRQALALADLALLVFDSNCPLSDNDIAIAELTYNTPTLMVWNKTDLIANAITCDTPQESERIVHPRLLGTVAISTITGKGIETLIHAIAQALGTQGNVAASGCHMVTNPRHRDALQQAFEAIYSAIESQHRALPLDIMAGDITVAMNALGTITGETVSEDLLNTIFSRFCIGK